MAPSRPLPPRPRSVGGWGEEEGRELPVEPSCQRSQWDRDVGIHNLSHTHTHTHTFPKLSLPSQTASTSSGPCRRPGAALGRTNGTEGCHEDSGAESPGWLLNRFCRLMVVEGCLVVTGPCCFLLSLPFFLIPTARPALPTPPFILSLLLSCSPSRFVLVCISVSPAFYLLPSHLTVVETAGL